MKNSMVSWNMKLRMLRRAIKHWWQRRTRGWDDSDLWSLDHTIAKFILPRLIAFRHRPYGYPAMLTEKEWDARLEIMTAAFRIVASDVDYYAMDTRQKIIVREGLRIFSENFRDLWQ